MFDKPVNVNAIQVMESFVRLSVRGNILHLDKI